MPNFLNGTVTDVDGVPVTDALVYVYAPDGKIAALQDSMGAPVDNPVGTDDSGYWGAFTDQDGFFTTKVNYGGRNRLIETVLVGTDPIAKADGIATALVTYTFGYIGIDDPSVPDGVNEGEGYVYTTDARVFGAINNGGTGVPKFEILTVASLASQDGALLGFSAGPYPANTVGSAIKWSEPSAVQNTGDTTFADSPWFTSWISGASADVRYIGKSRTGIITPGPSGDDRGYSGSILHVDARYDDADIGGDFGRVGFFRNVLTGSFKGGRIGVVGEINQQSTSASGNTNCNYVGIQGNAISHTGDGGTNLTTDARGSYFGVGALSYLYAAAGNSLTSCGIEVNTYSEPGSSVKYQIGLSIASANEERGSVVDAAIDIGGQNDATHSLDHIGWTYGLCFTDHHGADPTYASSILIGSHWEGGGARTILHGVDLSGFTVTGALFQGQRSVLTETSLTLGCDGSNLSLVAAGNGVTNGTLVLSGKGTGGARLRDGGSVERVMVDTVQGITLVPLASATPSANGQIVIEATSNTSLTFKLKGGDGIVRSASLALT